MASLTRLRLARALPALRAVWPWLLLAIVAWIGWEELYRIDLGAVRGLLKATDPSVIALLLVATAANLALAGLYDVVALGPTALAPRASTRWSIGVVAFAWSNFLTIGPLAGPALRLWLYRPLGVGLDRARRALVTILATFSATLLAWCGALLLPLPDALDTVAVRLALAIAIGAGIAYLAARIPALWGNGREMRRPVHLLAAIGLADWLLAWGVFHLAVSSQSSPIPAVVSMRAFFWGQLVGLASFIPGGFGSADLTWAMRLSGPAGGYDRVAAALVLYRAVYDALPFLFAALFLAGRLVSTGKRTSTVARAGLATYTFLCGAVLLASAASPSLRGRSELLERTVPLVLVEISHGASIALGFVLLLVSRGLGRGYRSSWSLAVGVFLGAALTTFLKGLDYEEALLALGAAVLLILFRGAFTREGRLRPSLEFVVSAGFAAVLLFGAVGLGSYAFWPGLSTAFTRFEFLAHEERFVRGLVVLASVAALVALRKGQQPRSPEKLPGEADLTRALGEARALARNSNALLIATGDKAIFRLEPAEEAYIAYRASGRFLVAWSDPVCPPGGEHALLAGFLEHAADWDREAVLYQISPPVLPVAHDLGFGFFKLGEEAVVDLRTFDLKGNKAKSHRHALNAVEKAGATFRIVEGQALVALLPEMRRVSDAWLEAKGTTEKGFSLGRFDVTYLRRGPCAVVEGRDGRLLAFANVLEGPRGEEISVDLMRHAGGPEPGAGPPMDFLLLRLMLDAKERGIRRFNLGLAPLAAVGATRRARPVERLAHQFFLHGDAWYNYQGLRRFKERFHPDWEPRYMAYRRPWDWPFAVAAATQLVSGGWKALLPAKGQTS